jgi:hypothetical protein
VQQALPRARTARQALTPGKVLRTATFALQVTTRELARAAVQLVPLGKSVQRRRPTVPPAQLENIVIQTHLRATSVTRVASGAVAETKSVAKLALKIVG